MALKNGKHIVAEIEGVRATVVESGLSESRALFLKELLRNNGFEVKMEKDKAKDGTLLETWILGVTDLEFNPMIRVYEQKIRRPDGHPVTPAYWNQWAVDPDLPYWMVVK
ncbi:MAG: hypothetical protein NTW10_01775 [Bacteroidetes bacterium]|nr:hypothetical protein [Bacteroidota bacterium]